MLIKIWVYIVLFIIGASIGSFVNVLEMRLFKEADFVKTPSHCPKCKHKLGFWDLIPILSFFMLKGRCRYCETKVSWQYPIIEFISGMLFMFSGVYIMGFMHIYSMKALLTYLIFSVFIGFNLEVFVFFALYDVKHQIVSNKVILPLIIYALFLCVFNAVAMHLYPNWVFWEIWGDFNLLWNIVSGALGGVFIALLIYITKGKGMGGGDLKLLVYMGLILGVKRLLVAFYAAIILGSILGIAYGMYKGKIKGLRLPFALFLSIGFIISFFWTNNIVELFTSFGSI